MLAEASGLDRDLAVRVMLGTTAGQGHLATTYPVKVLKGASRPASWLTSRIRTWASRWRWLPGPTCR